MNFVSVDTWWSFLKNVAASLMSVVTSAVAAAVDNVSNHLKAIGQFDSVLTVINGRVDATNKAVFVSGN